MNVLDALPRSAIVILRSLRTAALWAASPAERALGRGRQGLPPLWLRRHAGPVGRFESAAREFERTLVGLGVVPDDASVVDLGCGPGAMVPAFRRLLGESGRYLGLDVHAPSVAWCRRRWASDARFRFEIVGRDSPYATEDVVRGALPVASASVDLVLAKSVFTHVLEAEADALLGEIRRLLRPGRGRAVVTAFLFDGGGAGAARYFPHPGPTARVRWHRKPWPHAAIAFERSRFDELLARQRLGCERFVAGYWPGSDAHPRGQDLMVLAHGDANGS